MLGEDGCNPAPTLEQKRQNSCMAPPGLIASQSQESFLLPCLSPVGSPVASLHYALRKSAGKTVMSFRNNRLASGFQQGELGKTPEERRGLDPPFWGTHAEVRGVAAA